MNKTINYEQCIIVFVLLLFVFFLSGCKETFSKDETIKLLNEKATKQDVTGMIDNAFESSSNNMQKVENMIGKDFLNKESINSCTFKFIDSQSTFDMVDSNNDQVINGDEICKYYNKKCVFVANFLLNIEITTVDGKKIGSNIVNGILGNEFCSAGTIGKKVLEQSSTIGAMCCSI